MLETCTANRAFIETIRTEQARLLLQNLQKAWTPQSSCAIETSCLLLLARWCRIQNFGAETGSANIILRDAVSEAIRRAACSEQSPEVTCSACVLLSSAALVSPEMTTSCQGSICQALFTQKAFLTQSPILKELISLIARLSLQKQELDRLAWWVALLLQLWPFPFANQTDGLNNRSHGYLTHCFVSQMGALWNSMQFITASILQWQSEGTTANSVEVLVKLVEAVQDTHFRVSNSVGSVAAAGIIEGLNSPGYFRTKSGVYSKLEAIVMQERLKSLHSESEHLAEEQAAAFAFMKAHKAERRLDPTGAVMTSSFQAYAASVLSLEGVAYSESPAATNKWLAVALTNPLIEGSSEFASHLCKLYNLAEPAIQEEMRELVSKAIRKYAASYALYARTTPPEWMQAVDQGHLQQMLQKAFTTGIVLLSCFWDTQKASPSAIAEPTDPIIPQSMNPENGRLAAWVLEQLSLLQFCRSKLNSYSDLLANVYTIAAKSTEACGLLLKQMPIYADLIAPCNTSEKGRICTRWEHDLALAAEMQFRMHLLGPCTPSLQEADMLEKILPILYLYLGHHSEAVATAAQTLYCAVLSQVTEKDQLVPFYIQRSLCNYPRATTLKALSTGLDAIVRHLPASSPAKLFCLMRLSQKLAELITTKATSEQILGVVHLQAYMLLILDIQLLKEGLRMVSQSLGGLPKELRSQAKADIGQFFGNSDDVIRKVQLVRWLHGL